MIIDINWDNYEEVSKLATRCKSRALQLSTDFRVTSTEKNKNIFNAARNILETDIDFLFSDRNKSGYYVYAHCDTSKPLIKTKRDGRVAFAASLGLKYYPFYIGKGTGNRAFDLNRNETHRKVKQRLALSDRQASVEIIRKDLTEGQALALESKLIDIFGVIGKGGKLVNLDEGLYTQERRKLYLEDLKIVQPVHKL